MPSIPLRMSARVGSARSMCPGTLPMVFASRPARMLATTTHPASFRQKLAAWLGMPRPTPSISNNPSPTSSQAQSPEQPSTHLQASAATADQQSNSPSPKPVENPTSSKVVGRDAALMRQMQDREGLSSGDSTTSDHLHGAMGTQTRNNLFRYVAPRSNMRPPSP